MEYEEFSSNVREWIDQIERNRTSNPNHILEVCKKLEHYAEEVHSDQLMGYALFNAGFCHYLLNEIDKSNDYFSHSLDYLIRTYQWELVARCYNLLGITANSQGNLPLAMDFYFKGLSFCRDYGLYQCRYYININIATIYMGYQDMPNAIRSLQGCEELIRQNYDFTHTEKGTAYINLTTCYIYLHQLERANEYLDLAKQETGDEANAANQFLVNCLEAQLRNAEGNLLRRDEMIREIGQIDIAKVAVLDIFDDIYLYGKMLLEIEKYDELWQFISEVDKLVDVSRSLFLKRKMIALKIGYYKRTEDSKAYLQAASLYYEMSVLMEKEQAQIMSDNMRIRISLEEALNTRREVEQKNAVLKKKSEIDALTSIHNRYKLNDILESAFQNAYINRTPLGVEILDIDYFKQFNDNYGHQAGDQCLVNVAAAVQSLEEYAGVSTGRYGGDEFMLIYEGYDKKDIERMASILKERVAKLEMEHHYSQADPYVTISQGVFVKVPESSNKVWDFLYAADRALYWIKEKGRNSFYVSVSPEEVGNTLDGNAYI